MSYGDLLLLAIELHQEMLPFICQHFLKCFLLLLGGRAAVWEEAFDFRDDCDDVF